MDDESQWPARSGNGKGTGQRVGTADREEAIALLEEHWHAGRLDPGGHERRVTRAKAAVTQADIDGLFADLPRPGQGVQSSTRRSSPQESTRAVADGGSGGFLEGKRETIMALTPFVALALFFTLGDWMWFLLIPVMGIVMYGPGGKNAGQGRARNRNRDRG